MSKPTATVTNRYHGKKYDILTATIPKGYIAKMREAAQTYGKSVNGYVVEKLGELIGEELEEKEEDA